MLPPVTKNCTDLSEDRYFAFAFYCDACAAQWRSEEYPFSLADSQPINPEESCAHTALYKTEHDAAYERANTEALFHFNKCRRCGRRVCDNCFSAFDDICVDCVKAPK